MVFGFESRVSDPGEDRFSGRFRDFELNRPLRFFCTRSQPRNLLSIARLDNAISRFRSASSSRTRIPNLFRPNINGM
jgi:hypothetical protein